MNMSTWTFKGCPGWRSLSSVGASIGDPFEGAGMFQLFYWVFLRKIGTTRGSDRQDPHTEFVQREWSTDLNELVSRSVGEISDMKNV